MEAIKNTDLILIVAGLAGLLLVVLLYSLRQYQVGNRELRLEIEAGRQSEIELRDALHESEKTAQALQMELTQERKLVEQKIEQFEANRKQLKLEFENLANKILEDKSRSFDLTNKKSIESLLKPFREQVEGFQKRINDVHSESIKGNAALESEIKKVLEVGLKMGSDAQNLTEVLKGDSQKRGSWGETQLEKTLQISGLIEHDHYEKQTSMQDAEGRRKQTDFLIKLPDEKHIIIDSKVSLAAYDRAVAAESDEQLERALSEHIRAVKRHIDDLAGKDYTNIAGIRSPSFVLMFMPIEPAYIEALKHEKDLFSYGYERNIVLVSHTTLIPILRTVANLWSMERSTREARELGDKAGDIYNQVRKVAERLARIGGSLGAATNHYNETVRALSGRQGLRGKVERFAEMSSKVTQAIPEIEPLHNDLQSESLELLAEPLVPEIEPEAVDDEASVT
ncbi:MAG: DNA recombination protein RmuC [Gammaproteobacteria bacterium]|nr:DNA recombination protein RmuC [Gammaproteobacteria bacterium]